MCFYTDWKKKLKGILATALSALYAVLIVLFFMLEPSYNNKGGIDLPFSYDQGYSQTSQSYTPKTEQNPNPKNSKTNKKKETKPTEEKLNRLPNSITRQKGRPLGRSFWALLFAAILIVLIIIRNLKKQKNTGYENPYVDTNLYKLPFDENSRMPLVHFLRLRLSAGEKIYFATETNQKDNEGDFIITNTRVVIQNKTENTEFPLAVLEAVSSVSNSVIMLTSGTRKYYIFMPESQVKYALAVLRWAYKYSTQN